MRDQQRKAYLLPSVSAEVKRSTVRQSSTILDMNLWYLGLNKSGYQSIPSAEEGSDGQTERSESTADNKRGLVVAGWVSAALIVLVVMLLSVNKHVV